MSVVNDLLAKLMYRALYKMHLQAVHGSAKTMLDTLAAIVTRSTEPRIKLH
jgi:NADH dehydrogenase